MTDKSVDENFDDANITASVKATLAADKVANLTTIDVDINNGVISLNGVVEWPHQRREAAQPALCSNGVREVNNNLQFNRH